MGLNEDISRLRMVKPGIIPAVVWNLLIDILRSLQIGASPDYERKITPFGTTLDIKGGEGGGKTVHPYQGSDASEEGTPKVKIRIGTHNGITPTVEGEPMVVDVNENVLTLGSGDKIVYVQLNLNDDYTIASAEIHSSEDATTPEPDDSTVYQLLFFVDIDDDGKVTVADNVLGSQNMGWCFGTPQFQLV